MVGSDHGFTFDSVLDASKSQLTCFTTCAAPLLASVFEGYNATILAYGQTGSGKTFTMGTGNVVQAAGRVVDDNVGIVPRVISRMFEEIEVRKAAQPDAVFAIRVQFLELYGDDLRDLLFPNPVGKPLAIREDEHGTMQVRTCLLRGCGFLSKASLSTPSSRLLVPVRSPCPRTKMPSVVWMKDV